MAAAQPAVGRRDLCAVGLALALLSNAPAEPPDAIGRLPVAAHFGHLLFSCELKLAKPDRECDARALARLGAGAEEVIFIDDRSENVTAAAALSLQPLRFSSPGEARAAVGRHLAGRG